MIQFLEEQMAEALGKNEKLKNVVKVNESLELNLQSIYYSSWHYAAIHIGLTIPKLRHREALSKMFSSSLSRVDAVLSFLEKCQLITMKGNTIRPTSKYLHLDRDSPYSWIHHLQWRQVASRAMEQNDPNTLQFSSIFSLSKKDFEKVKLLLNQAIKDSVATIKTSPEETLAVCNIDFFEWNF